MRQNAVENDLSDFYLKMDVLKSEYKCYDHIEGNRMFFQVYDSQIGCTIRLQPMKYISKGPIRFYINNQEFTINVTDCDIKNSVFYEDTVPVVLENIIIQKDFSFAIAFSDYVIYKTIIYRNCLLDTDVKSDHIKYENCEFRRLT